MVKLEERVSPRARIDDELGTLAVMPAWQLVGNWLKSNRHGITNSTICMPGSDQHAGGRDSIAARQRAGAQDRRRRRVMLCRVGRQIDRRGDTGVDRSLLSGRLRLHRPGAFQGRRREPGFDLRHERVDALFVFEHAKPQGVTSPRPV